MCNNCFGVFTTVFTIWLKCSVWSAFKLHPEFNVLCSHQAKLFSRSDNRTICYLQMAIENLIWLFEIQQSCCNRTQCHCSLSIINIHQIIAAVIHWHGEMHKKGNHSLSLFPIHTHIAHAFVHAHIHAHSHSSVHCVQYHINASNLRVSPSRHRFNHCHKYYIHAQNRQNIVHNIFVVCVFPFIVLVLVCDILFCLLRSAFSARVNGTI